MDQDFYIDALSDIDIEPQRFKAKDLELTAEEISACRGALGTLQWLAVQTQPLICARCNLLLSDLAGTPTMKVAHEIQEVISEVRTEASVLLFYATPSAKHWQDVVAATLGDQAHMNRPKGDSTGGLLSFFTGPDREELSINSITP